GRATAARCDGEGASPSSRAPPGTSPWTTTQRPARREFAHKAISRGGSRARARGPLAGSFRNAATTAGCFVSPPSCRGRRILLRAASNEGGQEAGRPGGGVASERHRQRSQGEEPLMKTDWIPKLGLLAALIGGAPVAAETICAATADLAADGCKNAVQEDYLIASGKCLNVSATAARNRCLDAAVGARRMDLRLCRKQQLARFSICNALREDRYDPNVSPALFDDDLAHLTRPNRYFPLAAGDRWEWAGAESVVVEVLDRAKLIAGVRCFVVRDTVSADGTVVEDTEDWFAQARNGDTYYFGEESKDYEIFEGDEPPTPELITL